MICKYVAKILPYRWQSSYESPGAPAATLLGLPIELLLEIASYLPTSSTAALTLVCRSFLHNLGSKSWERLKDNITERRLFLHLLERDLPDYVADYQLIKKLPSSLPRNYRKGSKRHYRSAIDFLIPYERFGYAVTWPHVILALKRNAYGPPHGIPVEVFSYESAQRSARPSYGSFKDVAQYSKSAQPGQVVLFEARARIVSGHLLLRCTYRISNKKTQVDEQDLKALGLEICRHVGTTYRDPPWYDNGLARAYRSTRYDLSEKYIYGVDGPKRLYGVDDAPDAETIDELLAPSTKRDISGQCSFCCTEYQASWVTTPRAGFEGEVEIKAWHDLGDGKAPSPERPGWDPENTQWKALVGGSKAHDCKVRSFPLGSVRDAFEIGDGPRVDDGTEQ